MLYDLLIFSLLITLLVLTGLGTCALIAKILKNK